MGTTVSYDFVPPCSTKRSNSESSCSTKSRMVIADQCSAHEGNQLCLDHFFPATRFKNTQKWNMGVKTKRAMVNTQLKGVDFPRGAVMPVTQWMTIPDEDHKYRATPGGLKCTQESKYGGATIRLCAMNSWSLGAASGSARLDPSSSSTSAGSPDVDAPSVWSFSDSRSCTCGVGNQFLCAASKLSNLGAWQVGKGS